MAGHSKFKNIQHRKGAQDAKRSKIFAKFAREIMVAAKLGGEDINSNARLRTAIATAKAQSMPKDNITRAIKKGVGETGGENFEEIRYEGYGIAGVAVIVETLTDNRNRTASEVRSTFSKRGGNLGETGSVSFMFERQGEIVFESSVSDPDTIFEEALESGAEDVITEDEDYTIKTQPEDFTKCLESLTEKFGDVKHAELGWFAQTTANLDLEKTKSILNLVEALEDLEDVQKVYTNLEIDDNIASQLDQS